MSSGRSCRTGRRNESRAQPSLSRVTPSAVSEHYSELIGYPISCPFLRPASVLNQGPFPPPALPGFPGTTNLSATPKRPACPSRVSGLVILHHAKGLPVLRAFPLCTCCRHYPGTGTGGTALLIPTSPISLPRIGGRVGLCNVFFEDCSAFTHVTACTLAKSLNDPLHQRLQPTSLPP